MPARIQKVLLVLSTCPDRETATRLAKQLVEQKFAACVNLIPAVQSVYRWQDEVRNTEEVLLLIKTSTLRYSALEKALHELHPYEVPEIIAIPIDHGLTSYLSWVEACTSNKE